MSGIFIVAAKRTPFGSFGGSLKGLSATKLGVVASQAALDAGKIAADKIDAVFFGNVIASAPDAPYLARHVGLQTGVPIATPCLTVNRLCGSGFETVIQGHNWISLKLGDVALCGGTENMSAAPLQVDGTAVRWGVGLGSGMQMTDSLWDGLTDKYVDTPMGMTAENLAVEYDISRLECDEYAVRSQTTWAAAKRDGKFDLEMAPVEIAAKKGPPMIIDTDEHPRETTVEKVGGLKPVFKKDGVVTAANASGICDGAGAIVVASEEAMSRENLTPLARIVSFGVTGCDPKIMGIGPVTAIRQALDRAGLTLADMDRVEINEAFAAQTLACIKELDLDMDKTNIHGGAISLGHPLGASGSRIVAHLANEYAQDPAPRYMVGAACIGGGQGIAIIMERA